MYYSLKIHDFILCVNHIRMYFIMKIYNREIYITMCSICVFFIKKTFKFDLFLQYFMLIHGSRGPRKSSFRYYGPLIQYIGNQCHNDNTQVKNMTKRHAPSIDRQYLGQLWRPRKAHAFTTNTNINIKWIHRPVRDPHGPSLIKKKKKWYTQTCAPTHHKQ